MPSHISFNGQLIEIDEALRELDRWDNEESLATFLKTFWKFIDPAPFVDGWIIDAIADHLQAVVDGEIRHLIINQPPRTNKSSMCSVAFPAWVWAQRYRSHTSGPGVKFVHASYADRLSLRDGIKCRRVIESPLYQHYWGERFTLNDDQNAARRFSNSQGGERLITSVGAGITGEGFDIGIIDDGNSSQEVESDASIENTVEWWDGAMSTRKNNAKLSAWIEIQQRLGERDLTGHILSKELPDVVHLMIPMRFDPDRSFVTSIGWEDPRKEEGELAWPERFPEEQVVELEKALGPWRCNPGESPILMADLSLRRIDQIRVGDEVIGFAKRQRSDNKKGRFTLAKATVTAVNSHIAPVVKMMLDSGEVIRCTRDHRWFLKDRSSGGRDMYGPVTLRGKTSTKLARVCLPRLPELDDEGLRDAGWLAGFFDGEGSVSLCRRTGRKYEAGNYEASGIISIYQGAGRNKPLCDKLERILTKFGFPFTVSEDIRKPNKNAPCYGYRCYRLTKTGIGMLQKFLHVIRPTKWRERIIESSYKANFIDRREMVLSAKPDGEEMVYGLTTTTGNYVAWGLASSNSAGQLQQSPTPKGGGIIKREWWQPWEGEFPPFSYILATLDTAYTEKQTNDPSGMSVWGVFNHDVVAQYPRNVLGPTDRNYTMQSPRVMLIDAWNERLELHALVKRVAATCKLRQVDKLRIENKASGISVAQEMRRLFGNENWAVELFDPKNQDKMARLYSVQHIFAEGMVYAPDRTYAELVISQCETFPKAKHDEQVDNTSSALKHLRDIGLLQRPPEVQQEIEDGMKHDMQRVPPPLYPS